MSVIEVLFGDHYEPVTKPMAEDAIEAMKKKLENSPWKNKFKVVAVETITSIE